MFISWESFPSFFRSKQKKYVKILRRFLFVALVDILPIGSGSMDPHIFADPDQGSQNVMDLSKRFLFAVFGWYLAPWIRIQETKMLQIQRILSTGFKSNLCIFGWIWSEVLVGEGRIQAYRSTTNISFSIFFIIFLVFSFFRDICHFKN